MSESGRGHGHRPPQLVAHAIAPDGSPAPSSASIQSPLSPGSGLALPGPTSGTTGGLGPSPYHDFRPSGQAHRPFPHQYYGSLIGQAQQPSLPRYHDISHVHPPYNDHTASHVNTSIHGQQGQKRAYRQRRKDPSCDACRERKVKCDATDSSSCTECKSRNVICQFTKETNRRMTSIKQNQDLSKELATAHAEISELKSLLYPTKSRVLGDRHVPIEHLPRPESSQLPHHDLMHLPVHERSGLSSLEHSPRDSDRPFKRRRLGSDNHAAHVRENMTISGRGIFKSPYARATVDSHATGPITLPGLPPKHVADEMLRQYRYTIHPTLPIVIWRTFHEQFEQVYRNGSLHNEPPAWSALLFAIFACGTLHRSWTEAQKHHEVSKSLIISWTEDLTMDHARAALLNTMFLVESNSKSAGWIWMGIAVRIGFDLGLNCEVGTWHPIERELRTRLWWAIYASDCMLALEMGRSPAIKEEDCSIHLPVPASDGSIDEGLAWMQPTPEMGTTALLSTIRVVGPVARLLKLLKVAEIAPDDAQVYEAHFERIRRTFPAHLQSQSLDYVDPVEAFHVFYLQNARLMLHRHNLKPDCGPEVRSRAIDSCAATATSTAALLQNCMQDPPQSTDPTQSRVQQSYEERIMSAASAFVCTHVWRCTLLLLLRLDFKSALTCVKFSSIVNDLRTVNTACGRYLDFFLAQLIQKLKKGIELDTDEDLIAFASGDLQGDYGNSWVWQLDVESKTRTPSNDYTSMACLESVQLGVGQNIEWAGWDKIMTLINELAIGQRDAHATRKVQPEDPRLPPIRLPPLATSPSPSMANTPRDRLSIKDLL